MLKPANEAAVDELWQAAAHRIGGSLEIVKGSFLRDTIRQISAGVEGVPLTVEAYTDSSGKNRVWHTRVAAGRLPASGAVRIECSPRGIVGKLSKRLGISRQLTGDEAFDDACHIDASPAAMGLAFFDAPTRRLVSTLGEGFTLEHGRVSVVREGLPADSSVLVDMTRFVERLIERWCALVESLVHIAAALDLVCEWDFSVPSEGESVVARGLRRAPTTTLLVRVSGDAIETVVRIGDAEVAFAGLAPVVAAVVSAVEAAADRSATASTYR